MDAADAPGSATSSAAERTATLNEVLSEVIDIVQEVKQAHRKVSETHALHAELDQLFTDMARWAQRLVEYDRSLGVSPLAAMPSVAGRNPPNLWPGEATDDAVHSLIDNHLDRLARHLRAARTDGSGDARSRGIIDEIESEVLRHRHALE